MHFGVGDFEFGAKYRFVPESDAVPMLAIYLSDVRRADGR